MNEYLFKRFSERIWASPILDHALYGMTEEEADQAVKYLVEGLLIELGEDW